MPQKVDRPRPQQRPEAVSTLPPTLGATRASLRPDAPPARLQPTPRDFARSKSSEAGIGAVCCVLEQRARRNIESAWSPPRQAGLLFDTCRRVAWPLLGRPCSGRRPPSRRALLLPLSSIPLSHAQPSPLPLCYAGTAMFSGWGMCLASDCSLFLPRLFPVLRAAAILSRASPRPLDRLAARATVAAAAFVPMSNKNIFGLGPGVTGGVLGAVFFGVYLASSQLTKKFVMQQSGTPPEKPAYFRDVNVINEPRSK